MIFFVRCRPILPRISLLASGANAHRYLPRDHLASSAKSTSSKSIHLVPIISSSIPLLEEKGLGITKPPDREKRVLVSLHTLTDPVGLPPDKMDIAQNRTDK